MRINTEVDYYALGKILLIWGIKRQKCMGFLIIYRPDRYTISRTENEIKPFQQ